MASRELSGDQATPTAGAVTLGSSGGWFHAVTEFPFVTSMTRVFFPSDAARRVPFGLNATTVAPPAQEHWPSSFVSFPFSGS